MKKLASLISGLAVCAHLCNSMFKNNFELGMQSRSKIHTTPSVTPGLDFAWTKNPDSFKWEKFLLLLRLSISLHNLQLRFCNPDDITRKLL